MLVQLPIYNLTQAMSKVLFPAMSSIQHDVPRLRRVYMSSTALLAAIILPLGMGLSVAAREAILTVIGAKFEPAVPILAILAIMTPFRLLTYYAGIVCDSTGHLNIKIRTETLFLVANIVLLYLVSRPYGVVGICYALLLNEFCRFVAYLFILRGILHYAIVEFMQSLAPAAISALFVGLCIWLVRVSMPVWLLELPLLALLLEAAAGGLGLGIGLLGPWSRALRQDINVRFLSKSSLKDKKLVQVFVNL
jgi:O-antigen/teichoic acid export membrane protein